MICMKTNMKHGFRGSIVLWFFYPVVTCLFGQAIMTLSHLWCMEQHSSELAGNSSYMVPPNWNQNVTLLTMVVPHVRSPENVRGLHLGLGFLYHAHPHSEWTQYTDLTIPGKYYRASLVWPFGTFCLASIMLSLLPHQLYHHPSSTSCSFSSYTVSHSALGLSLPAGYLSSAYLTSQIAPRQTEGLCPNLCDILCSG